MVERGVSTFKLFMAYPNVLMIDDGLMFRVFQQAAKLNALCLIHAENGSAIDVVVAQTLAARQDGAALSRADTLNQSRGGGDASRAGPGRYGGCDGVHRASVERGFAARAEACAGTRRGGRWPRTCDTQYLVLSLEEQMPGKSFEVAKYVFTPPSAREEEPGCRCGRRSRMVSLCVVSTDHCPFRFADQEVARQG